MCSASQQHCSTSLWMWLKTNLPRNSVSHACAMHCTGKCYLRPRLWNLDIYIFLIKSEKSPHVRFEFRFASCIRMPVSRRLKLKELIVEILLELQPVTNRDVFWIPWGLRWTTVSVCAISALHLICCLV